MQTNKQKWPRKSTAEKGVTFNLFDVNRVRNKGGKIKKFNTSTYYH